MNPFTNTELLSPGTLLAEACAMSLRSSPEEATPKGLGRQRHNAIDEKRERENEPLLPSPLGYTASNNLPGAKDTIYEILKQKPGAHTADETNSDEAERAGLNFTLRVPGLYRKLSSIGELLPQATGERVAQFNSTQKCQRCSWGHCSQCVCKDFRGRCCCQRESNFRANKPEKTARRSSVRESQAGATAYRGREAFGISLTADGATSITFQSAASALSRAERRRRSRGSDAASFHYGTATKRLRCAGASCGTGAGFATCPRQKGRSYRTRLERGLNNVNAAAAERNLRGVLTFV